MGNCCLIARLRQLENLQQNQRNLKSQIQQQQRKRVKKQQHNKKLQIQSRKLTQELNRFAEQGTKSDRLQKSVSNIDNQIRLTDKQLLQSQNNFRLLQQSVKILQAQVLRSKSSNFSAKSAKREPQTQSKASQNQITATRALIQNTQKRIAQKELEIENNIKILINLEQLKNKTLEEYKKELGQIQKEIQHSFSAKNNKLQTIKKQKNQRKRFRYPEKFIQSNQVCNQSQLNLGLHSQSILQQDSQRRI